MVSVIHVHVYVPNRKFVHKHIPIRRSELSYKELRCLDRLDNSVTCGVEMTLTSVPGDCIRYVESTPGQPIIRDFAVRLCYTNSQQRALCSVRANELAQTATWRLVRIYVYCSAYVVPLCKCNAKSYNMSHSTDARCCLELSGLHPCLH